LARAGIDRFFFLHIAFVVSRSNDVNAVQVTFTKRLACHRLFAFRPHRLDDERTNSRKTPALQTRIRTNARRRIARNDAFAKNFFDEDRFFFLTVHYALQQRLHLYETLRGQHEGIELSGRQRGS
jgi:hypothetical protein